MRWFILAAIAAAFVGCCDCDKGGGCEGDTCPAHAPKK